MRTGHMVMLVLLLDAHDETCLVHMSNRMGQRSLLDPIASCGIY
jgi:hypothetical protein